MNRVFVTGMGVISSIGNNVEENRTSLLSAKTGIGKASFMQSRYVEQFPFGEVPYSSEHLLNSGGMKLEKGMTRTDILATLAFQEACTDAGLTTAQIAAYDTAFMSASTVGGMSMTDELYKDGNHLGPPSEYLSSYICGAHTLKLVKRYAMKGLSSTINTACSSSANAIMMGSKLIQSGRAKRAIVGGAEGLAKFTVNGFNALRILSANPCTPFDENRTGLTLGEGAAYLVLEDETSVGDKTIYGEISGYGNSNDAFHPSSISDEAIGIIASIKEAIQTAGLSPAQIDYINAHGTGTVNNDYSELYGISQVFDTIPAYQSTKSYTGHTLAAAGVIEAIFSLLSIQYGELYQSLNCPNPIEKFDTAPILSYRNQLNIQHVLSNSFGFGGNCSSLVLSKV